MLEFIGFFISTNTAAEKLPELWNHMQSAPVTIIFTIFAIAVLYYLPRKVSFFKNVSLGRGDENSFFESNILSRNFFSSKKRNPILKKTKNLIATFIYFLIFMTFLIIFISLVFNLSTQF